MDVSKTVKRRTEFTIDNILRDERDAEDEPSWLCCTRYQPPRIQRTHISNRSRRSGRHARVPFTAVQALALESAYSRAHYLAPPALKALAAALQLREERIKIWFQNRRARERREKCVTILPPDAIRLPATIPSKEIKNRDRISNIGINNEEKERTNEEGRKISDVIDYCDWSDSSLDVETID